MRFIAVIGIAFKSTLEEPFPIVPLKCTRAEPWRRLPFTSTKVWSGDRPRKLAGRTASEPSVTEENGKL